MHHPLQGIRAVECGVFHAGPGALAILADLGAEVIKVEAPGSGDPIRKEVTFGTASFDFKGRSMFFDGANRNKKSVTIDLKSRQGQEIVHRLVARSDVFLTNLRKGAVQKMRLGYPVLREINPSLIYAYVSAYGSCGPDSERGGFDFQGQARSGLMYAVGEPGMDPMLLHFGVLDQMAAIVASHGILTALFMRERTGIGQEVETSLLGSAMFAQYFNVLSALVAGMEVPRHQRSNTNPLRNYYRCSDGRWISIQTAYHKDDWKAFCQAIGQPALADDPRFSTVPKRRENRKALIAIFDDLFRTRPWEEWHRLMAEVDFISAPVNSSLDLKNDPQVTENDYIADCDHPVFGRTKVPGYPVRFSEASTGPYAAAPELGSHTDEVLREVGGYSDEEIRQFRKDGVI